MHCQQQNIVRRSQSRLFYRVKGSDKRDTGWTFFVDESDEEDEPDNVSGVTLGALLRADDRVIEFLDKTAPIAFRWHDDKQQFIEEELTGLDDEPNDAENKATSIEFSVSQLPNPIKPIIRFSQNVSSIFKKKK